MRRIALSLCFFGFFASVLKASDLHKTASDFKQTHAELNKAIDTVLLLTRQIADLPENAPERKVLEEKHEKALAESQRLSELASKTSKEHKKATDTHVKEHLKHVPAHLKNSTARK